MAGGRFPASYDSTTKILSALACVLFGIATIALLAMGLYWALLLPLVPFVLHAFSTRAYFFSDGAIVVKRLIGDARVPLENVCDARKAQNKELRGCLRLWSSGGWFGWDGLYWNSKLGKHRWYVTNRKNIVIVVTGAKTALFSPDDVNGFIAAVGAPTVTPGTILPRQRVASGGTILSIVAGVALLNLVGYLLVLRYSPGLPAYTLTPHTLEIHDRFYPVTVGSDAIDLERMRIVDLSHDGEWRPVLRTNGFANSHYQCGWFRAANGSNMRVYRAGGARLVLLPPKGSGAAVLFQAADPVGFMEQVRQAWDRRAQALRAVRAAGVQVRPVRDRRDWAKVESSA